MPERQRFAIKVNAILGQCWEWSATMEKSGYGRFRGQDGMVLAHRYAYEWMRGPIPPGLTLDHTCRNTRCVNPAHLEPVTALENYQRYVEARRVRQRDADEQRQRF
jgi:hypothetical protein